MATQIDTGYGVITIDDQANFYGNIAGVDVSGNVDEFGTGSVYTNYLGESGAYYFEGGQLVGYPGLDFGGEPSTPSFDEGWYDGFTGREGYGVDRIADGGIFAPPADTGSHGSDQGVEWINSYMYSSPPADTGSHDWLRTSTDWGVDLSGVTGSASAELDFGWPVSLTGSAEVGFDWSERELSLEVGLGLSGENFINSLINPEDREEVGFVRDLLGTANDQVRNAVENLGTNIGGFYYNTVENIGNARDTIMNYQEHLFRDFENQVDEVFAL